VDKVKLPRNVADSIEKVWYAVQDDIATKYMRLTNWNFLRDEVEGHQVLDYDFKTLIGYAESFPLEYMQALVNGYEVEQTPEERIRTEYLSQLGSLDKWCCGFQEGIKYTLKTLDIKIKGVNA
jgi:hypothetical protein